MCAQLRSTLGSSIKYLRSEGEGVVRLKEYWLVWGERGRWGSTASVLEPEGFFGGSLQNKNKESYSDSQKYPSPSPRTFKKRKIDPRTLLDIATLLTVF